jgi:hypothetical protein
MKRSFLLVGVICGLGVFWPGEVTACGDKFLVIGRGARRVPKARHPAAVLLYLRPGSPLLMAAREMRLEATLRQAGHGVETLTEPASLREGLAARRYDFVLVDLADAAAVQKAAEGSAPRPQVVPVAYKALRETLQASESQHDIVIRAGKSLSYLAELDRAMGRRASALASR